MASPFSLFRKHQRWLLAGVTFVAMISFVVATPFFFGQGNGGAGPSGNADNPVVATWKFPSIRRSDIDNRLTGRTAINRFLAKLMGLPYVYPRFPDDRANPAVRNNALDTIVFHQKAEQLGLTVSDQTVNEFIDGFTRGGVSKADKVKAAQASIDSRSGNADSLFDALRYELMAEKCMRLLVTDVEGLSNGPTATPQQRWDYFSRMARRATIQAMPVDVKDFVDQVKDPDDSELHSFYEKYKDQFSDPYRPVPGFKVPAHAKFSYVKALRDDYLKVVQGSVTESDIKAYYDKHKEDYLKPSDDDDLPKEKAKPTDGKKDSEKKDAEKKDFEKKEPVKKDAEKKDVEKKAAEFKDSGKIDDKPASDAKPPAVKETEQDKKSSESVTPPAKDAGGKQPAEESPDSGKKSLLNAPRHGHEQLLALADEAAAPAAKKADDKSEPAKSDSAKTEPAKEEPLKTDTPKSDPVKPDPTAKAEPAAKSDPAKTDSLKTDSPKTDSTKVDPAKADAPKTDAPKTDAPSAKPITSSADPIVDPIKATVKSTGATDQPKKPIEKIKIDEYQPFEKVHDKIRDKLAGEKAAAKIEEETNKLSTQLGTYAGKLSTWQAVREGNQPVAPNFEAIAEKISPRLKFGETDSSAADDLASSNELGKSISFDGQGHGVRFAQQAYAPAITRYKPYRSYGNDGEHPTEFLWWRTSYDEPYVPTFAKTRDRVLKNWKMVEARKKAIEKAKEYARQATDQRAELKEMFGVKANLTVKTVGPFTWVEQLNVARNPGEQPQLRMSQPAGLDIPGEDFMRTTFSLQPQTTGVALNQPQTIAYVIQLEKLDPSEDDFRRQFLATMSSPMAASALQAGSPEMAQSMRATLKSVMDEFAVKPVESELLDTRNAAPSSSPADDSGD